MVYKPKNISEKNTKITPVCSFCKKRISGSYIIVEGTNICQECYKKSPTCARCKKPMKEYLTVKDKKLCLSCASSIEYCASCHIPLLEGYFYYPGDERKFCKTCSQKGLKCDICLLPLGKEYRMLKDKRKICSLCLKTSVHSKEKAHQMMQKMLPLLSVRYSMDIRSSTHLHLVDYTKLSKIRSQYAHSIGSKDHRSLGIFIRKGNDFDVYIEDYLPYSLCLAVLAHEYTHAWQADHFRSGVSALYVEGMAQWISYHILKYYGYEKQASLIPLQKDVYGQGFHKIYEIEKQYGKDSVIQKILQICGKSSKKFTRR